MDFSKLDVAALAEDGSEMIICYPGTKTPILDEKGEHSSVMVRGPNSPVAKAFFKANERALMNKSAVNDVQERSLIKSAVALAISFKNVSWNGVPVTEETFPDLLKKNIFIATQISEHFANGDNFLPKTPGG